MLLTIQTKEMKSLKEQADPNCEVCKGTGQDTMTTGFTCVCDCVKETVLSEEDKPPLRLKQYGVNDLSPVSETPVFTERMKWFAQQLKDHNVPEHIADAIMNPIHTNQAGFEAANKAMEEIEKAEIEREAIYKSIQYFSENVDNKYNRWTYGYTEGVIAERSRLSSILLHSESKNKESVRLLEIAGKRIKELEAGLSQVDNLLRIHNMVIGSVHRRNVLEIIKSMQLSNQSTESETIK